MNEFNLNPIPHNPITKVTNDRNPKREQKQEQEKKKKQGADTFNGQDKLVEQDLKITDTETEVSKDTFSVGGEAPKAGYTVDWVKMNNMKHSRNEP